MKILIAHHNSFELWQTPAWLHGRLQREFPDHRFLQLDSYDGVPQEIADAEIFIGWRLQPEHFANAKKLKWIHSPTAAVHQLMYPVLVASSVLVSSSTGVHGPVVAEHAIAVLLALAKRLPQAARYQAKKQWSQGELWREHPRPREVAGACVVVIGMGNIGREFTSRAKALGMKVLAVRVDPGKGTDGADAVFGANQIEEVLPQADYVLLCPPVTSATERMIDQTRLEKMKSEAYLINVARGDLVDEPALLRALQERRIAGAALDVFEKEPLTSNSPLWELDNVLITPHTAAVTEKLWERHYQLIAENLNRFWSGQPLLNLVDKKRGY